MSRRKTVRVLRLEGRVSALSDARSEYSDLGCRLRQLFNEVVHPTLRDVRAAVREGLLEMEATALRDTIDAQRAREEEA